MLSAISFNSGSDLGLAAERGDHLLVKTILKEGINRDYRFGYLSRSPLHLACANGHRLVVEELLKVVINF